MTLHDNIKSLLTHIGPGLEISRCAYDTAWVARLAEFDRPLGQEALEWLRASQLPEGCWGTGELRYHHERVVCTLSAMMALARCGNGRDQSRLRRAQLALETESRGLGADPAGETIGFEMIVPSLLEEANALGIIPRPVLVTLEHLSRYREAKLSRLPGRMINRYVTVAFSAEMVGAGGLQLLDVERLQEANGSVAYSPSATAFYALQVNRGDEAALAYLQSVAKAGAVPYTAPIDVFEQGWCLWNLAIADSITDEIRAFCQPHLDFLRASWKPGRGIAAVSPLTLIDGDTSAMIYETLLRYGRPVDLEALFGFEQETHFRCFGLEANPSISTNVHMLSALRRTGLEVNHPSVAKVREFLAQMRTLDMFWFDKWHASPYYTTAHAIIAATGYDNDLVDDAVYWITTTQNKDGSWGYYLPTAEETAYCLQALCVWKRHGGDVPDGMIARGATWLADHEEPPFAPLWIGKSLYCPVFVVRSAILSALICAQEI